MSRNTLAYLRTKSGLTQKQLGTIIGAAQNTISNWENGTREIDNKMAAKIAAYFGVTVDFLLYGTSAPMPKSANSMRKIPVLGKVSAGVPLEAIEDILDYEEISSRDFNMNYDYFGLKINGDSMEPEYRNGDIIIVRKQNTAETGEDAVIFVNGDDATFKRIRWDERGITIVPLNSAKYTPWYYTNEQIENLPVRILGIAVEVRRKIR